MNEAAETFDVTLPASIVLRTDVARLLSELEALEADGVAERARKKAGSAGGWEPILSEHAQEFLSENAIDASDPDACRRTVKALTRLKNQLPVVHATFATAADQESLQEIVAWLRREIDPRIVLTLGLQPDLVGGVYLRTANHVHDFSYRGQLAAHRDVIRDALEAIT